jgi:hypothetical protein
VKRALRLLDELRDIIEGETRFEITEIAGGYLEGVPPGGGAAAIQPPAQCIVNDFAKGPAGASRFRLELGRHVIIEGQRSPHALMLLTGHHDVKAGADSIARATPKSVLVLNRIPYF